MHNGKEMLSHSDFTDDVIGFVYGIKYTDGTFYIGKKLIRSIVKLKPTKEQLKIRKNYVRKEWRDKPFAKYEGSSSNTKGLTVQSKKILELCSDKLNLTYCEIKWMMSLDVLCDDRYHNENILGKFFKGKIHKGK